MANNKTYTPEQTAEFEARKQAEMDSLLERINKGVEQVFQSDKFKEYLKFASKFTNYSANNTVLISMQKPDATLVAAFGKWQALGRSVNKGEHGISILAPVTFKTNQVQEFSRPATDEFGNKLYNADGTEKQETVQKPVSEIGFKKVTVFDVSQTSGKELPEQMEELKGNINPAKREAVLAAVHKATGMDISFENIRSGAKGYCSYAENRIVIKAGMSDSQTLKTAFHEAAHHILHDPKSGIVSSRTPRNEKEVQAESVAFVVADKFGMDTSEYSFPYIASWSKGKPLEQLKKSLSEIQQAAKKISAEIESELLKLQKRSLSMEEKLADMELNTIQKAEFLIEDCSDRGIQFNKEDTDKILDFAGNHEDIQETVKLVSDMESIQKQRDSYGYDFTYMNPIDTKEAALEAFDKGEAVYLLYPDNTEGQALERSDIEHFEGFFGIEKEPENSFALEQDSGLIPVSKDVALEMWDMDLDVYIDGIRAENREQIENAPDHVHLYLSEFQYAAQLDFDKGITPQNAVPKRSERQPEAVTEQPAPEVRNPNVIGNTPYKELGAKDELQYYTNLKNRHADNVAKQLDEDGIKFSGLRKGTVTTITVNKADIPAYEAAVTKVKESYARHKAQAQLIAEEIPAENVPETSADDKKVYPYTFKVALEWDEEELYHASNNKNAECAKAIDKAITDSNYELYRYDLKTAAASVLAAYGEERLSWVMAEHIQWHDCDGRYSSANKAWANGVDIVESNSPPAINTHPAVLDGFITRAREQIEELKKMPDEPKPIPEKQPDQTPSFKDIPVCTQTLIEAKQNNNLEAWKENKAACKACVKLIDSNLSTEYESRNLKGFVKQLEEQFGMERAMYSVAATIQLKGDDGRFTREVKDRAAQFPYADRDQRLNFLTERHPVMLNYLYERLIDREKELKLAQPEPEKPKLPSVYDDKFLFSTERVELRDDYRGIPETKYYTSSANEYFVQDVGWLDNAAYDREQRLSELSAKDFYAKVTRINANYIDSTGLTGQMDMSKQDYALLTEKTYAPENSPALENAKAKLDERRMELGGIKEKPTQYCAVRQANDRKFAVCSISADGIVDVVKPNIATVAEAKKAMHELFEQKKDTVRCEFVHPQTLDEKSAEIYKGQSKELPDVTYRIKLNPDKQASPDSTHFLQKYVKNADDTYKVDEVVCKGDYDKCNVVLAEVIKQGAVRENAIAEAEMKKTDFEIYQIKDGDEYRDIRFESFQYLMEQGVNPKFKNYNKVYEAEYSALDIDSSNSISDRLEAVFDKFNNDRPEDFRGHSMSVSDVIVMDNKAYYADSFGFQPLKAFVPERQKTLSPEPEQAKQENASEQEKPQQTAHKKMKI